ncbi:putative late blight resistance protein homolog R1B-16 isoform X4 [Salvia hispanica]|uniref:putative late blight resistance protein homolog R1B-16 isoform X4 n=1 Tax=Salvia hispanica TaxID=49212 RepID=UPI002009D4E4|nr:putative late blight resistance protein homolog R1B-16 isoform X4 [Salvia hispanica]
MNELESLKDEDMKYSVLLKLQMIRRVYLTDSAIRNGFLKSIPNIRKLGCNIMGTSMGIDHSHLHKLKILRVFSSCLSRVIFPCNIRKLFLHDCAIKPGELTTLHKLEVLKINRCMFGSEWESCDGDIFCSLQFLCLEELRLVRWIADETNFPRLRHLFIEDCPHLKEIPGDIGEIPTLQLIELVGCSDSALASARRIEEVQQSEYDNYDLRLRISRDHTAKSGFSNADES